MPFDDELIPGERRPTLDCIDTFGPKSRAILRVEEEQGPDVSLVTLAMWCLFGMSGWWSSNAISAELPLLVVSLPAKERLGNQLSMMTQLGNIVLIAYRLLDPYVGWKVRDAISGMLVISVASLLLCSVTWDIVYEGTSVPLLVIQAVAGSAGCMSNATYWAFMMSYPPLCTKAVSFGMSLGGVMTMLLSAAQVVGCSDTRPRFNTSMFLLVSAVMQFGFWVILLCVEKKEVTTQAREPLLKHEISNNRLARTFARQRSISDEERHQRCLVLAKYNAGSFLIHAAAYCMPSLIPFAACAYSEDGQTKLLLLLMLFAQQVGGSVGRISAPSKPEACIFLQGSCIVCVPAVLALFVFTACRPELFSEMLPFGPSLLVLTMLVFWYFFSYGLLQTLIFLRVRHLGESLDDVEKIASDMGIMGQMGALTANIVACILINFK
eukprot:TRINITY_DN16567_c0_g1_i1.p1 TRINITY_DN16567_c0_g1~~TRINITY_DN16567_c0_g1_i1.p1  ORF type:complete len:437 (+),score=48.54 TRINITY_DN16567_c0_g1_i1:98-1408(+)